MKKHLPTTPDSTVFEYKEHIIKDSANDRDKTLEAARQFVEEVVIRLEAAFPDAGMLHALTLFDPSQIRRDATQEDLARYGEKLAGGILCPVYLPGTRLLPYPAEDSNACSDCPDHICELLEGS
ncbi:hypothetical protein LSAT2_012998 [Lamellibrachia satsuma]|nr:hypothetical protein LSAT2_012998 [Lamellibrachia satsuma]